MDGAGSSWEGTGGRGDDRVKCSPGNAAVSLGG